MAVTSLILFHKRETSLQPAVCEAIFNVALTSEVYVEWRLRCSNKHYLTACRERLCELLLERFLVFIRQLWLFPLCFDGGGFDLPALCLRVDEKWKWKIVAVTSPPGVCEFQNLRSGPYYGPPITQKCWFRAAGFSVNKWSLCVCAWLRCECQLLVPFSPHLQPLTLHCLHVVLFMSNKPFLLSLHFFFF